MLNTRHSIAAFTPLLVMAGGWTQEAQAVDLSQDLQMRQLHNDLQASVCRNDWDGALAAIQPLIGTPNAPALYREQLVQFRDRLETWRAYQAEFSHGSNCAGAIASNSLNRQSFGTTQTFERPVQNIRTQQLYRSLQGAVCRNDWDEALSHIGPLMASDVSASYREHLVYLRHQLEGWRASNTRLASTPGCRGSIAQASPSAPAIAQSALPVPYPEAIARPEFS
jgi:hypothetical protein